MDLGLSILIYGITLSVVLSTIILGTLYYNPRLLLQSYPANIQKVVAVKTKSERIQTKVVGMFFLLFLIGTPVISTLLMKHSYSGEISFLDAFFNMFGIMTIFNILFLKLFIFMTSH